MCFIIHNKFIAMHDGILIKKPAGLIFFVTMVSFDIVLSKWKSSSITPVPKVPQPKTCQDSRLISVTPVLSRLMEKEFIRLVIYPLLD